MPPPGSGASKGGGKETPDLVSRAVDGLVRLELDARAINAEVGQRGIVEPRQFAYGGAVIDMVLQALHEAMHTSADVQREARPGGAGFGVEGHWFGSVHLCRPVSGAAFSISEQQHRQMLQLHNSRQDNAAMQKLHKPS